MEESQRPVRLAARALARAGLVNAYGHCSMRVDDRSFLVCAPRPMGLIRPGEAGAFVQIEGPLPEGVLGEVRIHQQIYRARADVGAVCRVLPPNVLALSTLGRTPLARHGFGSYFFPRPPLWDDPLLIRSDEQARGVAAMLGAAPAVVMRGNGSVVVGADLPQVVTLAWYLEDSARLELTVLATGEADRGPLLTADEARQRAAWSGGLAERMWQFLTAGDPEL